jgi:hypothetical protein
MSTYGTRISSRGSAELQAGCVAYYHAVKNRGQKIEVRYGFLGRLHRHEQRLRARHPGLFFSG